MILFICKIKSQNYNYWHQKLLITIHIITIKTIKRNKQNFLLTEEAQTIKILNNNSFQDRSMLSTLLRPISQQYTLNEVQFSAVNLSSCSLSHINSIPMKMRFISQLYLDNNFIQSLKGIQLFMNLELFHVNFNFISQKNQILRIRNRFLLKDLSVIGNTIQNQCDAKWLKINQFRNIVKLNQVDQIGRIYVEKYNQTYNVTVTHSGNIENIAVANKKHLTKNQHSIQCNQGKIILRNSPQKSVTYPNKILLVNSRQKESQKFEISSHQKTKRINKNIEQPSYTIVHQINNKKSKDHYQSTAQSTLKLKSKQNQRQNQFFSFVDNNDQTTQRVNNKSGISNAEKHQRRVNEFVLYPQQAQNGLLQPNDQHYNNQNYYQLNNKNGSNSYKENSNEGYTIIQQNQTSKLYNHPFEQTYQTNNYNYSGKSNTKYLNHHQKDKYYLKNRIVPFDKQKKVNPKSQIINIRQKNKNNTSQQSQKFNSQISYFRQLLQQKGEIPLYKQAIGIAFYYRNLLQKVFQGFKILKYVKSNGRNKEIELTQKYQNQSSEQYSPPSGIKLSNLSQNIVYHNQQKSTNYRNDQLQRLTLEQQNRKQLMKEFWIKLQMHAARQTILSKYKKWDIPTQ